MHVAMINMQNLTARRKLLQMFETLVHCTEPADISDGEGEICRLLLYTCQLFLSQRHESFTLRSVRVSEDDLFPKISGNFLGHSKEFQSSEVSECV